MYVQLIIGAIILGSWIYHRWFQDHPASPVPPQVTLPRSNEGIPLPLVYGQVRVRAPILIGAWNSLIPGQSYAPWNPGTFGSPLTTDHYSVDMLFCLGVPFYITPPTVISSVTLLTIWAGDTPITTLTTNSVSTGVQRYYGGPGIASGVTTDFSVAGVFWQGDSGQVVDTDITGSSPYVPARPTGYFPDNVRYDATSATGTSLDSVILQSANTGGTGDPAGVRNQVCTFVHCGLGLSPDVPALSFEIRALQTGTDSDMGSGVGLTDAEPAAVLYDLLTSPWGKLGISKTQIDKTSFQACATTLSSELNGYSRVIDTATDASEIIQEILKQIDGVMYPEPTNGLMTLRLIRFDYVAASLTVINPDNAEPAGSGWYSVSSWAETPNQVRLIYKDRSNFYNDAVVIAQDQANAIFNGGRLRSVTIQMPGCCSGALATKLAARELAAVSRPLVKVSVVVNRSFYQARPGSVYAFTWPELGISNMVMRVASVNMGQLHDNKITLQMIRDIFDVKTGGYPRP